MVGLGRFELPTSRLSGVRSNQLSYRPDHAPPLSKPITWSRKSVQHAHPVGRAGGLGKRNEDGGYPPFWPSVRTDSSISFQVFEETDAQSAASSTNVLRKEVIQPQVPLRLPCYDFTPVTDHSLVSSPPKVRTPTSGATNSHGVTGGVYKARERIHRSVLISDY